MKQYSRSASDPVKEQIQSLCSKYGFEIGSTAIPPALDGELRLTNGIKNDIL